MGPDDFRELVDLVEARSTNLSSACHGPEHWKCVAFVGVGIAQECGHDPLVPLLFGLFHDAMRMNDHFDPGHGPRAGELVLELAGTGGLSLAEPALADLFEACKVHTRADPTERLPLGICLDADRVNLWRVSIRPQPRYLSTRQNWTTDWIELARPLHGTIDSWDEVYEAYAAASRPLHPEGDK